MATNNQAPSLLSRITKPLALAVMGLVLFVFGVALTLYAPWMQDGLRVALVKVMNSREGTSFRLDRLRLWFPLRVEAAGLAWVEHGDTVAAASGIDASVSLLPLLAGNAVVENARLTDASYRIGSPDSATCVSIRAGRITLAPARVQLLPLHIYADKGAMDNATVDIYINPNPPKKAQAAAEPSALAIDVDDIAMTNFTYRMSLLPTIDSLSVNVASARLRHGKIDLRRQTVDVRSFTGTGLNVAYIAPDSATVAATVVAPPDSAVSEPWTVKVHEVAFRGGSALYTTRGVTPLPGLDFAYIQADSLDLAVKDFFNRATDVRIPLSLRATERCGVRLAVTGELQVSDTGLLFDGFDIATANGTSLAASGRLGTGDLAADPSVPLALTASGHLAVADASLMFPTLAPLLAPARPGAQMALGADVAGTSGLLRMASLSLSLPGAAALHASGTLSDVMNPDRLGGDIAFDGTLGNVEPWVKTLLAKTGITVPAMTLDGRVRIDDGTYTGRLKASTRDGSTALSGSFNGRRESYKADLTATAFPLQAFMPSLGIGDITAHVVADGRGFDFLSPGCRADVTVDIDRIAWQGTVYSGIAGHATLADSEAAFDFSSLSPGLEFTLVGQALLTPRHYDLTASFNGRDIDLAALKASDTPATLSMSMSLDASLAPDLSDVAATLRLGSLSYAHEGMTLDIDQVTARLNADTAATNASVRNRDLFAYFSSPAPLDSVAARFGRASRVIDRQIADREISVTAVQQALPRFNLDIDAGSDNLLTQILSQSNMGFGSLGIRASNDSALWMDARMLAFRSGATRLDTVAFSVRQHGERLVYDGSVDNRPGTFDQWAHVNLRGFFETGRLGLSLVQRNIEGRTGFDIGASVTMQGDSAAVLRFDPCSPVIAYKPWTVNDDNFISYNFRHRHLDADLRMSSARSSLALFTEHARQSGDSTLHGADEDIVLNIDSVRLQDWISINPFAPPLKGTVSADMRLNWQGSRIAGNGSVSLADLVYGKQRVGDLRTDMAVLTDAGGLIRADLAMFVDGRKSLTLSGALNDSTRTSPLDLDLNMIHFPLRTANPFIPGVARLSGYLDGHLGVSGDNANPRLNGALSFDSATVGVDMLGTTFTLSPDPIAVADSRVAFDSFAIRGMNENPLTIDGTVDMADLMSPRIDLALRARDMQIVNTSKAPRGADIYGKAFIDLDATARGNLRFMNVDASATVLSGTNVTYIVSDAENALASRSTSDMVKFVSFSDTTAVLAADSIAPPSEMMLNVNASLTMAPNSTVNVDLSGAVKGKAQIKSQGTLNFTMSPLNAGRLTGRLNIDGGYVRVTPPMMSEKNFALNEGSYVSFSGNMMNPTLNIQATDHLRANVTQEGQNSRLIYFDIGLSVTGTLENMDATFNLSTDDDATVANELATMSPSQRASTAMNLLVTNIYSGGNTTANANLGGNALYSFLTSQLNTWAANAIHGVDITFGINQFDRTQSGTTSQTMQYSYSVSKSLLNDRIKIVVGGNYTDDATSDESIAQNLINDISFEYFLNKSGTMFIRIFRHTGYESILEGEITQTGVGFVYKRKINRIADMFIPRRKKTEDNEKP